MFTSKFSRKGVQYLLLHKNCPYILIKKQIWTKKNCPYDFLKRIAF